MSDSELQFHELFPDEYLDARMIAAGAYMGRRMACQDHHTALDEAIKEAFNAGFVAGRANPEGVPAKNLFGARPWIDVTAYWGDLDDFRDRIFIGPYESERARNAEIKRLNALPTIGGSAGFTPHYGFAPADAKTATAEQVAAVTTLDELIDALYGAAR